MNRQAEPLFTPETRRPLTPEEGRALLELWDQEITHPIPEYSAGPMGIALLRRYSCRR